MQPTIGRIVLYKTLATETHPSVPVAALINKVREDGLVSLTCFGGGGGIFYRSSVSEGEEPGQWSWPPMLGKKI